MWSALTVALCLTCGGPPDSTSNPEFGERLNHIYRHSVATITVDELTPMMRKGAFVLDTREQDEFDVSHIRHARHVGYIWFDMREIYDIPKTDTIVVYCAIGTRSERIGEKLQKAGYQHVFNLFGGIYEWVNQHNPVYNADDVQTTEVHVYDKNWSRWLTGGAHAH